MVLEKYIFLEDSVFVKAWWIFFQVFTKCREVFQDFTRCREVLQNFPCRVFDFSMIYQKLACILFMCMQNFLAFSTRKQMILICKMTALIGTRWGGVEGRPSPQYRHPGQSRLTPRWTVACGCSSPTS